MRIFAITQVFYDQNTITQNSMDPDTTETGAEAPAAETLDATPLTDDLSSDAEGTDADELDVDSDEEPETE